MTATLIILAEHRARLQRAACPIIAPRLTAQLIQVAMGYALLPLTITSAALAGYAAGHRAVMFPGGEA